MKSLLALPLILAFGACSSLPKDQVVVKTQYKVVLPPDYFYACNTSGIKSIKDVSELTDAQIATLLVTLDKDNVGCAQSLNSIKKYLATAKRKFPS